MRCVREWGAGPCGRRRGYLSRVNAQRESAVLGALAALPRGRWVLAVSGGRDSMVLLHAMARARAHEVAAVATFDHGTGPAARRAVALVEATAESLLLPAVTGEAAAGGPRTEAAWRAARHRFLDAWAAELDATVVTAHTRDDQVETVVQRLLRGAGPRGLAGMLVGGRARPFVRVPRATLADWAAAHRVPFVEDPSNQALAHQRNRVRHELLPALERAAPGFADWCWSLGERSAAWRDALAAVVTGCGVRTLGDGSVVVPAAPFAGCVAAEWAILWPEIAARAGVVMDRRGIERAAAWAPVAKPGQVIPLSGDARLSRTRSTFVVVGTTGAAPDYILD